MCHPCLRKTGFNFFELVCWTGSKVGIPLSRAKRYKDVYLLTQDSALVMVVVIRFWLMFIIFILWDAAKVDSIATQDFIHLRCFAAWLERHQKENKSKGCSLGFFCQGCHKIPKFASIDETRIITSSSCWLNSCR